MVADTQQWEQSAGFMLDTHPGITKWVKNDHLGFIIPYRRRNVARKYIPDFIVVTDSGENLIVEIKGQMTDDADIKAKAAERWVAAVNRLGNQGHWQYLLIMEPTELGSKLNEFCVSKWNGDRIELGKAV